MATGDLRQKFSGTRDNNLDFPEQLRARRTPITSGGELGRPRRSPRADLLVMASWLPRDCAGITVWSITWFNPLTRLAVPLWWAGVLESSSAARGRAA